MWENLLAQTELTLNLLCQSTLNPCISEWGYFNGAFEYTSTPLGPIGCKIIIHTTSKNCNPGIKEGREGFIVGPAIHHYHCIQAIGSKKEALIITDTSDYLHEYLTQPSVTSEDRMTHTIHFLSTALKYVPTSLCDSQIAAIEAVCTNFANWITIESSPTFPPKSVPKPPKPIVRFPKPSPLRYPAPTSKGKHDKDMVTTSKGTFKQ